MREQGMLDPARLVFIDETAVSTNLVRLKGRAPRGIRVIGTVPLGAWETITFVAALRHHKMTAPMVVEGAMTREMFLAYVEQCLVPTLRRNDIVVMDNCRVHLGPGIREAIEKAGAIIRYLPKYSPTLIRLRCLTANSRRSCASSPPELFRPSIELFAPSSHRSALKNAPTISAMQGMLQYERNPL
jgi:transposase